MQNHNHAYEERTRLIRCTYGHGKNQHAEQNYIYKVERCVCQNHTYTGKEGKNEAVTRQAYLGENRNIDRQNTVAHTQKSVAEPYIVLNCINA